jgi:3alpha(or 20beta)-hydroxysteroid dehydrogenase
MTAAGTVEDGRVALVVGGAGDIGAEVSRLLRDEGAEVVVADRVAPGHGDLTLDVTSPPQWERALATVEGRYGRLDVLINAAGVEGRSAPLWEQSPEEFAAVMGVNATGVFLGMRCVLPSMRRAGRGAIVNVASTAGVLGVPGLAPYVASKHAVVGLARGLAHELAPHGIRVNTVHPGGVKTPMVLNDWFLARLREDDLATVQPLLDVGLMHPQEISNAMLWLASDEARWVTGCSLPVDAGLAVR